MPWKSFMSLVPFAPHQFHIVPSCSFHFNPNHLPKLLNLKQQPSAPIRPKGWVEPPACHRHVPVPPLPCSPCLGRPWRWRIPTIGSWWKWPKWTWIIWIGWFTSSLMLTLAAWSAQKEGCDPLLVMMDHLLAMSMPSINPGWIREYQMCTTPNNKSSGLGHAQNFAKTLEPGTLQLIHITMENPTCVDVPILTKLPSGPCPLAHAEDDAACSSSSSGHQFTLESAVIFDITVDVFDSKKHRGVSSHGMPLGNGSKMGDVGSRSFLGAHNCCLQFKSINHAQAPCHHRQLLPPPPSPEIAGAHAQSPHLLIFVSLAHDGEGRWMFHPQIFDGTFGDCHQWMVYFVENPIWKWMIQ